MKIFSTLLLCLVFNCVFANKLPTSMINGVKDERHSVHAFTNIHLFIDEKTEFENGILLIQDNKVINVGENYSLPKAAIIHDMHGAYVYPSFILMDSGYGLSEPGKRAAFSFFGAETMDTTTPGAVNTNEAIKASYQGINEFHHNAENAKALRAIGFGLVLSSRHDGIMRGSSVLVNLNEENDQQSILNQRAAFHLSFDKGSSKQLYPISLMGSSALIRQTWLDAKWYGEGKEGFTDRDLKAVNDTKVLPNIFETKNWQQTLLADKIAKEFGKNIIVKTSGDEYKHLDAIKKIDRKLIVPLKHIKAPDVSDYLDAWNVSLEDMKDWELSPYNAYFLHKSGVQFSLVPDDPKTFIKDLVKSVEKGLPKSAALAALTTNPAKFLNNNKIGNLRRGSYANFIVVNKDIFEKDALINENWVAGKRNEINKVKKLSSGLYQLVIDGNNQRIELKNDAGKITIKSTEKDSEISYKAQLENNYITLRIDNKGDKKELLGLVSYDSMHNIVGQGVKWTAKRVSDLIFKDGKDESKDKIKKELPLPRVPTPYSAYGYQKPSVNKSFLITNATVWTNEKDGVLTETDVFIKDGKIKQIGQNLKLKADAYIDAKGKHLTAGIIDEHSHIALLSVNDIMANSSMVRMEDSLDSDDINIYRNLAGGVTAAQLLHGSANPIGGQSALIKMRWGATGDELLIKGADKFIKFALGENVKRSASQSSIRYPLTRMGVEQVYRDAFNNALAYEKQNSYVSKSNKQVEKKPRSSRRDLMMEATLEVVKQQRSITCHSYVQSEINMLMKVAEDFGFRVNTFTHILEGYKLADKMLAHGVGASTFADWWAYKWEVNYAIPYNASILTKAGVTTAINSDDAEMARRLNQEAAKSIKYGGLSEQEALKMVTLNPAKLLHLDHRMGSIKEGKDGDIVLWSDNPLSIYAKAEKTFVDGKLLFDRDKQNKIEQQIKAERVRLISAINKSDEPKTPAVSKPEKHMQCDSLTGYEYLGAVK